MANTDSTAETKRCKTCTRIKPLSEFHKQNQTRNGRIYHRHQPQCKDCRANTRTPAHVRKYWHPRFDETLQCIVKRCARCKTEKPLDEFPTRSRNDQRKTPYCGKCRNEIKRREYAKRKNDPARICGSCLNCGAPTTRPSQIYCGQLCQNRYQAARLRKDPSRFGGCLICGKPRKRLGKKYCSSRCNARVLASLLKERWRQLPKEEQEAKIASMRNGIILTHPTSIEILIGDALTFLGISFEAQVRIGRYTADYLIKDSHLIVECDGCYWHGCEQCGHPVPKGRTSDEARDAWLESKGFKVVRLKEHSIRRAPLEALRPVLTAL